MIHPVIGLAVWGRIYGNLLAVGEGRRVGSDGGDPVPGSRSDGGALPTAGQLQ